MNEALQVEDPIDSEQDSDDDNQIVHFVCNAYILCYRIKIILILSTFKNIVNNIQTQDYEM